MSMGLMFWILMLFLLIFGFWSTWPNYPLVGHGLIVFLLLALLGWHSFGAPVHG